MAAIAAADEIRRPDLSTLGSKASCGFVIVPDEDILTGIKKSYRLQKSKHAFSHPKSRPRERQHEQNKRRI